MESIKTNELNKIQKAGILKIWNDEYPDFLVYKDVSEFEDYLNKLDNSEHHIIVINGEIVGWVVKFDRKGQKWFVIMVNSIEHTKGIGTKLINLLKENSTELNGWVIDKDTYNKANGERYKSPIRFYEKVGFEITAENFENEKFTAIRVKWAKKISTQQ